MIDLKNALFTQLKNNPNWFNQVYDKHNFGVFYWNSESSNSIWIDNQLKTKLGYTSKSYDSSVYDVCSLFQKNIFIQDLIGHNHGDSTKPLMSSSKELIYISFQLEVEIDTSSVKHILGIITSLVDSIKNGQEADHNVDFLEEMKSLKALTQNLPGFFYQLEVINPDNFHFNYISEGINRFGLTKQNVLTNPYELLSLLKEQDVAKLIEMGYDEKEKHKALHKQFEISLKDDEKKWIEVHDKPFIQENGNIIFNGFVLDITDRIKVEEDFSKIIKIFTHSIDMLCIAGFDGYFKLLNPAWSKTLGWSTEELLSRPWNDFVHPEDLQKTNTINTVIIDGKEAYQFLNRYICKDGSIKWLSWSSFPYPKEGIMYGIARDVTNQIAKEAEYTALFSEMLDGFALHEMVYDENGIAVDYRFIDVNPAYENITGLRASDIIGKTVLEILPNTEKYWIQSFDKVAQTGKSTQFENYSNEFDKHFEVKAFSPAKDQFVSIFTDITDRKKAEHELSESEEYHRSLFKAMPDMIFVMSKDGVYLDYKASSDQLFSKPENFLGKNIKDIVPKEIQEQFKVAQEKAFKLNEVIEFQYSLPLTEETRYYNAKLVSFGTDKVIVIVEDITESILNEQALTKLNIELKEQTKSLQQSNQDLEQFAYVASHDLQEPLRMISSFLTLLERSYGESLDEKAQKYIQFSVNGALRMQKIISDLLEFSKVGKKPNHLQKVDLNEEVNNVLTLYNNLISQKKATVQIDPLPIVYIDKSSIQQIFSNLVGNALKFQKKETAPIIHISCKETPKEWQFSIKDNGIGIETSYFKKIFEMFQRLHTAKEFSGSGMGLSITKKIIENINGSIWLESDVNTGTTFYFTIPKQQNDKKMF